ncbi:MAG TPA: LacI family DNA-binding transcriptional regulator, partial [Pseudoxanthomonas sp.]|nr:LacI family DNA-binding transcriptional regulator [Pseudoxanthomonas sp.]
MPPSKRKPRSGTDLPTPGGHLTMADLAKVAGVSAITVSRALRDSPLVNTETRERVRQIAK